MHWEEPWVHEKHGGGRGGLGQGKERGAGCVGGGGRASGRACTGGWSSFGWGGVGGRGNGSSLTPPPLRLGSADSVVVGFCPPGSGHDKGNCQFERC